jgi:hypothetical protein
MVKIPTEGVYIISYTNCRNPPTMIRNGGLLLYIHTPSQKTNPQIPQTNFNNLKDIPQSSIYLENIFYIFIELYCISNNSKTAKLVTRENKLSNK